jgi:kinetochore protein Mis12/MTW1
MKDRSREQQDEEQKSYPAFAFLSQKGDLASASAATPLSTTTAFALSQLPAMKSLLSDLRPSLHTLSSPLPTLTSDPNLASSDPATSSSLGPGTTWRQQRLEYIETQTRRLHENVRGLELGPQGAVRDGEWQEEGRRVGMGEVEALERVVGLIGGGEGRTGNEMDEGA